MLTQTMDYFSGKSKLIIFQFLSFNIVTQDNILYFALIGFVQIGFPKSLRFQKTSISKCISVTKSVKPIGMKHILNESSPLIRAGFLHIGKRHE
jgi:hypothetical protein